MLSRSESADGGGVGSVWFGSCEKKKKKKSVIVKPLVDVAEWCRV